MCHEKRRAGLRQGVGLGVPTPRSWDVEPEFGLKLEPARGPVDVTVVDGAEKPAED